MLYYHSVIHIDLALAKTYEKLKRQFFVITLVSIVPLRGSACFLLADFIGIQQQPNLKRLYFSFHFHNPIAFSYFFFLVFFQIRHRISIRS